MSRTKNPNKVIKNILRALPAIPFVAPRRRTPIVPFVLSAIGVAIAGGIAAVMVFSPRTRYRALDMAKDGYGRVRGQLGQLRIAEKLGIWHGERTTSPDYSALPPEMGDTSYSSTGI